MNTVLMLKLNIVFCLLLVNFLSSFSSGGQAVLREGGNEGEAGNQLEGNNINSEQKYRKEASLIQNNGPQIGDQTQVETYSETNVKSEKSIKTQSSDDTYSEQCSKESQKLGNVQKPQEQVMDKTVQLKGGNEGEDGNQLGENKPSKIANSEKRYSLKEESMTPDSEPKIGPQTPEKIQTDMNKHSESIASTHDIISGGISKELQKLGNVEISKKEPTKDTIKIFPKNKYDKESEVRDNPVSIGKRDTERLLPAVTGGVQRLCKQPDIFFFQKEPVYLTCQPDIKGTKEFKKDFKKASTKEKKNKQKPAVSRKGVSTPKQQNEKKFKVNYASKQCGATIEENNQEVENVNHIITSKKDEYLNNPCAANKKWFVIKLCETIYVKEIKTGSFELESSQPRDINVDVSDRYPAKEYHSLGVFQLTEGRTLHRFEIKRGDNYPAKYVKVEMLTHYGEEHYCPLTFFKVYGKPVELDAYDRDQEGKYIRDNIEESNPLNAGAKKVIDANYASSSEKIEPSESTAEKTNTNTLFVVIGFIIVIAVIAALIIFLLAVVVLYKSACILTSKDICALNRPGQYTTIERISAHESQQAELDLKSGRKNVSHKTQPTVPDSESSNRSVNQAGNTTVHYDRNKNANMAVSNREQYQSFSLDQDASIEHDVLLMYADKDKKNAETLHDLLKSNSNTRNLNVVLFDYFAPDVQNIFKTTSCIFQRCRYLFILVTNNLKHDGVKRYQGQIALFQSIMKQSERVVPIWTEDGNNILPELSPLAGIPYKGTRYRLPPGPWAWPIIGNLRQLNGKEGFYHYVLEFRKTYGDIFRLKMGVHEVVFVFGHQHVQEVLCKNGALTSNRPNWMYIPNKIFKGKGIVWNNRDACKALRSVLKLAQEDSYVVASLQRYLATEFDVFQSHVKDKSSAYDLEYLIGQTSFNFLSAFLLGKRYSYDDPTMIEIRNKLAEFGASTASANPENYLPFLANFTQAKFQTAAANQEIVFNRFREIIQEKRNTPEDPPTDFLRIYLSNYEKEGLKNGTCEADLLQAVMDMFLAGKDNLLLSTKWILMALVNYPEVQSKCRSEIHQVIGQGQRVQSQDRSRTPYTVATIKEIQRLYSPVTFTVFHYPEQDIQVGGYDVPKDTLMMIECKAPCRDKQFWKDPEVFNPDRFLGIDGEGQLPEGCFIPYGEGPRYCIGKYVADMFMYFLVANIMQNFKITTKHPEQPLSFENAFSFFGLQPLHFPEIKLEPLE